MPAGPSQAAAQLSRNAVDCLPEGGLEAKLKLGRPLRVKLGIDPTAPDIHLGFTVVLQKLREFQDAGHTVVLIIGDGTARVGDPSGRSVTRPILSDEEIRSNAASFQEQALKVLDSDRLEVRFNGDWLDMPMADLLRLLSTTTVAHVIERDDFAKRLAAGTPVSMLELLYPLLQGYDSVAVKADVELGGTDQKFNLLLGRDIQRAYGQDEQVILTMPLLTGTDGDRKMSKSFGNYIGVTEAPDQMYGKTLSIPDESLESWYSLLVGSGGSWRGSSWSASMERRRRPRPKRRSTVFTSAGSFPMMSPRSSSAPMATATCICRRCSRTPSAFRARRRGARCRRAASGSTVSRCPVTSSTSPLRPSTSGSSSSESAGLRGF
jgi:tryptophanyl-tRNA synthetase